MLGSRRAARRPFPTTPTRRLPIPADWGIGVTVCIGAINAVGDIVTASDQMLTMSMGTFSGDEAAAKVEMLTLGWRVMFAADDVGVVPPLIRRIRSRLYSSEEPLTVDFMIRVLRESYQEERLQRATEMYLSPFGIDLSTFLSNGAAVLGDNNLAAILRERIERHELGCELLVSGHEEVPSASVTSSAHLLVVSNPGIVKDCSVAGYWAIGSGAYLALSSLATRRQNLRHELAPMIYNVCEAKFAAESAIGVGRETFVTIHRDNETWTTMEGRDLGAIRRHWNRVGKPRPANRATTHINHWLDADANWHDATWESKPTSSSSDQT